MRLDTPSVTSHAHYLSRYASLLEFNHRVLCQALDEDMPLMERLKFLCISSSNLDEFFEVRIAALKHALSLPTTPKIDQLTPQEILEQLAPITHSFVKEQYRVLNEAILPELAKQDIIFLRRGEWLPEEESWLRHYFIQELLPILTPIALDPAHPFPRILNKSLNFIVALKGKDAFGRDIELAIVQAPRALPRLIPIPKEISARACGYVFLSSVIHAFIDELFPGMKVTGCYQFRVTRNSDLFIDEEEAEDLLHALQGELRTRHYGASVRLEVVDDCPRDLINYLLDEFDLKEADLYLVNGPVNLGRLLAIYDLDRPELKFPVFAPKPLEQWLGRQDWFALIRAQDILLHHPYQYFTPVIELLKQAAQDPQVLAIKQTLYRTGPNSPIVDALMKAARNGKEVSVVVELRARFDEEANINLANRLQEVGAHVSYGVVGYKAHAKMLLIVRREENQLRRYVHMSTGNYHPKTATLYEDYGLFTAHPEFGEDVHRIFLQLTSLGKVSRLHRILQAPFSLHGELLKKIAREIQHATQGKPSGIFIKVNSLVEEELINALYAASQAGVVIKLIVRGMCSLRPGVAGLSESIEVISIVGRFLEHSRVFHFVNGGHDEIYLGSADCMERNLLHRVEILFPILDHRIKERILRELGYYLTDNTRAWRLQPDGCYLKLQPSTPEGTRFCVQQALFTAL